MLNNISSLVNVKWYLGTSCLGISPHQKLIHDRLGIPFFQTSPFNLAIAEIGQSILGDNLIGLQGGNEPDLYAAYGLRCFMPVIT
jgi:hypothetical protein